MGILALLVLLGLIVCWIIVLIQQFKHGGVVHGIIGILCSLWTFIWGWMNASKLNIRNIMIIWTILLIVYIILAVTGNANFNYGYGAPGVTTP